MATNEDGLPSYRESLQEAVEVATTGVILQRGGMPGGFLTAVTWFNEEGVEKFSILTSDHLTIVQHTGLMEMLRLETQASALKHMGW